MEEQSLLHDKNVKRGAAGVLGILTVFLVVLTANAVQEFRFIGSDVPPMSTITVSGEGEVFAVPDIATISFTIREEGEDPARAQELASEKINAALDYLEDQGLEEKDIKTTNYNAYPRYEYREIVCEAGLCPSGGERVLVGYEINQTISVKVRDTDEVGGILAGLTERGVGNISGPSFEIDDTETLERDARKRAIDEAEEQARELARDLGVRLVRVISFNESGGNRAFFFDAAVESFGVGGADKAVPAPNVPTGENRIVSNVSITYEIR